MRLTLRTLLAYLDDVLDPADKEELSRKIESSEFAEDLVHRTRDVMRRLRLSAPQVVGSGTALDPNTVSEYLDNVLPPEQVGDFERICLESDVHLAEAAACHHVLTMVLGEPADVDPRARQRMYGIPAEARERKKLRVEPAHVPIVTSTVVSATPMSAASAASAQQPARDELPEYLRTGTWWRSRAAWLGLAVVLLAGVTMFLVAGWFGGGGPRGTAHVPDAPREAAGGAAVNDDRPSMESAVAPNGDRDAEPDATVPPLEPLAPLVVPDPLEATPDRYEVPDVAAESDKVEPPATEPAVALLPREPVTDAGAIPLDAGPAPDAVAAVERDALPAAAVEDALGPDASVADEEPAGPAEIGTYLGAKTVLLRWDDEAGAWFRIVPREAVRAGDRLLALPEFRPKLTLAAGIHIELSGGTQVVLGDGDEGEAERLRTAGDDVPTIDLAYGRLVLLNTSGAENRVRLVLGPTVGEARLARNATLAVELERKFVPGSDPRQTPAPVVVRLYAPDGGVVWQDAAVEVAVDEPGHWTIADGVTSEAVAEASAPEWIDQEPVVQASEQRFGAPVVEGALVSNRPVDIQLMELFQGSPPRREVKSLAARSGGHVGLFAPFIDALRDSEQRANWRTHIESLRAAMVRSPESAEKVYQALVEQRGKPAAGDLYEMLRGYSLDDLGRTPEQIKAGALPKLIDWLQEDSLDYRVLAVEVLRETTGKQLMPNPTVNPSTRAQNVRTWRLRLEKGELRPLGLQ